MKLFKVRVVIHSSMSVVFGLTLAAAASASPTTIGVKATSATTSPAGTTMSFPITRTAGSDYDLFLAYHTEDGTAVAGTDYVAPTAPVLLPAGQTATAPVVILPSSAYFSGKGFQLSLDSALAVGPAPSFSEVKSFFTLSLPTSIVAADFNGDGLPDTVVANQATGGVWVRISKTVPGSSVPSFSESAAFAGGGNPAAVAVADINHDGKPDLIVADSIDGIVSVLLNTTPAGASLASFTAVQNFTVSGTPRAIAVADLNRDGLPDIAVATTQSIAVLLNTTTPGSSSAAFAAAANFADGNDALYVAAVELNGDGIDDLVVGGSSSNLSVLLNTTKPGAAAPSFGPAHSFAIDSAPSALASGDFNGDGHADIVAATTGGKISVLINKTTAGSSTPAFYASQSIDVGAKDPSGLLSVTTADINGDGRADIVFTDSGSNNVSTLVNVCIPGSSTVAFEDRQNFKVGKQPSSAFVADINDDGMPDIVVANQGSNSYSVLLSSVVPTAAGASFAAGQSWGSPVYDPQTSGSLGTADFNKDGKPDLVAFSFTLQEVAVSLDMTVPGASTISFSTASTFSTGTTSADMEISDVNNDGKPDIALIGINYPNNATLRILLNTTPPGAATAKFSTRTIQLPSIDSASLVDINGDGRPDIVSINSTPNGSYVMLNATVPGSSTPAFSAPQPLSIGSDPPGAVVIADINGDGLPDLVLATQSDNLVAIMNTTAPGSSSVSLGSPQTFSSGTGSSYLRSATDLNNDGKPDLVFLNGDHTIGVMLNFTPAGSGTPSFLAEQTFPSLNRTFATIAADINGDGKLDLVTCSNNDSNSTARSGAVLVNMTQPGSTTASFAPYSSIASTGTCGSTVAADFNGDGQTDIAAAYLSPAVDAVHGNVFLNTRYQTIVSATAATGTIHYTPDTTPTPFSFTPVTGATVNTAVSSAPITVSGINKATPISISGGSYSINGAAYKTAAGNVNEGDTVSVKQTSSPDFSTRTTATLTIGGVNGNFNVTTQAIDTNPDPFSLTAVTDAPVNTAEVSDPITVTGINAPAPISIVGGSYSVGGQPYTTATGTVKNGQIVKVKLTSSPSKGTKTTATLTIGNRSAAFNVTTKK